MNFLRPIAIVASSLILCVAVIGQTRNDETSDPQPTPTPSLEKKFLKNILSDQRAIWTAPFSLHRGDGKWLAPLGAATIALMATDRHTSGELFEDGDHRTRLNISRDVSRLGSVYATGGVAAAFYLVGRADHNERARETGLLAAETLIDAGIVTEALKAISQRPRPPVDHASAEFFDRGNSFPSGHSVSAWSVATIIANEYGAQRPLVRFGAYGLAAAVSLSRYTGTNHFLSDVVVGSALGYGIGKYVYRTHHDRALDGDTGTKGKKSITRSRFFPEVVPSYSARTHTYAGTLSWHL
jgi:membrane-associated phospholipid phosphatase